MGAFFTIECDQPGIGTVNVICLPTDDPSDISRVLSDGMNQLTKALLVGTAGKFWGKDFDEMADLRVTISVEWRKP